MEGVVLLTKLCPPSRHKWSTPGASPSQGSGGTTQTAASSSEVLY